MSISTPNKSVHITNYYHKNSGGISTAYNKLLEAANRRQRFVRLIVPGDQNAVEEVGDFGRIYFVKANYSPIFDKRYRLMMPWKTYILDAAPIKVILRDEKPDIVEIGEKYTLGLMAGLLRKKIMNIAKKRPMLVHFSCERMDDNVRSFISAGAVGRWFCRRFMSIYHLPMFDFHVANSAYTAQEMFDAVSDTGNPRRSDAILNFFWRFLRTPQVTFRDRIFVNPCGVDSSLFDRKRQDSKKRASLQSEYCLPNDAKLLLYAGRVSPEKNIGLLTAVMNVLQHDQSNEYRLLLAGDGPSLEKIRSDAKKLKPDSVKILGHINNKEKLADLFANCDAFVHPNPREPFGITPLEAMASGLPVVAPNSGGVLSYANAENSWLAEPNASSFAEAISCVFTDEAVRATKVTAALKTALQYTWEASTDALFTLYDTMYTEFTDHQELYDYNEPPSHVNFAASFTTC